MAKPVVSVIILTYNQERFIRQCIESVLSQRTTYPYEIIIGEDMGTDRTRAICRQYADDFPQVILPDRETNLGVTMNWIKCVEMASGDYIMALGGDDYWHNTNKIQIQVDFMEAHPECVICHTDYNVLNNNTGRLVKGLNSHKKVTPPEGMIQKEVVSGNGHVAAGTMCIRKDLIDKYIPFKLYEDEHFPCEDWPTIAILSAYGEVRYIPISTLTYRMGQESILRKTDYNKIREYWALNSNMARVIHELFPKELGPYEDEEFFSEYVNHSLLLAAYHNKDYESACVFAKRDPQKSLASKMTRNRITFFLYRIWRTVESHA